MDKEEIIDFLRKEKSYLNEKFGLLSIGLLGSFSKGDQSEGSDVDFLVEFSAPSFDCLAGLQIYLEEKLGKPVELVRKRKNLSNRFLKRIEKDLLYV